jgi:hypothetical protein
MTGPRISFHDVEQSGYLEMTCKPYFLTSVDKPLCGIVLIPFDSITVVHRELVVEIVVTFTDSDECSGKVVARGMLVVEWRFAKPVCKRVDAKGGLKQAINQY